jgi:hypothetical protein
MTIALQWTKREEIRGIFPRRLRRWSQAFADKERSFLRKREKQITVMNEQRKAEQQQRDLEKRRWDACRRRKRQRLQYNRLHT